MTRFEEVVEALEVLKVKEGIIFDTVFREFRLHIAEMPYYVTHITPLEDCSPRNLLGHLLACANNGGLDFDKWLEEESIKDKEAGRTLYQMASNDYQKLLTLFNSEDSVREVYKVWKEWKDEQ